MGRRRSRKDYTLGTRKKPCPIDLAKISKIDHKDVELLKLFITEKGKIIPGRANNISAKNQNKIGSAIKRARNIALLSFVEGFQPPEEENEKIVNDGEMVSKAAKLTDEAETEVIDDGAKAKAVQLEESEEQEPKEEDSSTLVEDKEPEADTSPDKEEPA